jgi:hypothetical protein
MATTVFLRDCLSRYVLTPGTTATDFIGRLTTSTTDQLGRLLIGRTWAISQTINLGDYMQQSGALKPLYQCTVAGTTLGSGTGPTAPGVGLTVTDNTVTWRQLTTQ